MESVGYSGTPLWKKLGLKANFSVKLIDEPNNYFDLLGETPDGINYSLSTSYDLIHFFVNTIDAFENQLPMLKNEIKQNGSIWISWYKKFSKQPTELTEDIIRDMGLAMGLVDVKVCAVDEKWSGLKLVIRVKDRK
jgi:hypothetical protein